MIPIHSEASAEAPFGSPNLKFIEIDHEPS